MKKLIIALLIAIFILSISVPAFAYPSTDHFISSGKVNDVWWFKGFGYLYGDDEHWYDLAIELWDSSYTYVLAQGSYTAYEDVIAISNKGYDYDPVLIIADTPWVDLGT